MYLGVSMLICFCAHVLVFSHSHVCMLSCLNAHTHTHTHTHTHICLEADVLKKLDACAITCYDTRA